VKLDELVDLKTGLVQNDVFSDYFYRQELESIFRKCWIMVGHDSSIPKPGDYILSCMGEDSVIVQRDRNGAIRVYLNKCRHRGVELCLFDRGNARSFTCSYHGWTFTDGKLTGVPHKREAYFDKLDVSSLSLVEVPKVANYGGLIFACWSEDVISIEDYLGEARFYLDNFLLRMEMGGLEVVPAPQKYLMPINWKLLAENFAGDMYHFGQTHGSVVQLQKRGKGSRINFRVIETEMISVLARGTDGAPHGFLELAIGDEGLEGDLEQARQLGPECEAWVLERQKLLEKKLKNVGVKPYSFHAGNVFPNFALIGVGTAGYAKGLILHHPRGPNETEVWVWAAVEKSAPKAMKERQRFVLMQRQAVAGIVAPDDHEIFRRIRDNISRYVASLQPFHYVMGIHETSEDKALAAEKFPGLPGRALPRYSEAAQRAFYRYWTQKMQGSC
jgi:phenylpropionate dioxygenase-like ring-hydroxylating dioxygenase large terminal subunit